MNADESTYTRRVQYTSGPLRRDDLAPNPVEQWHAWHADAVAAGAVEPNAMTVATVDDDRMPDARIVLARKVSDEGITFFTNYESTKSQQIDETPLVAAVFGWLDQHRQVRVRGPVRRVDAADSDAYFASRPRGSQIGAWASPQSEPIEVSDLEARIAEVERRFDDREVTRPEFWGGWRIEPVTWEFWQGRENRLHDRFVYQPSNAGWTLVRLAP